MSGALHPVGLHIDPGTAAAKWTVKIVSSELVATDSYFARDYVVYVVEVRTESMQKTICKKRYSEFEVLHQSLLAVHLDDDAAHLRLAFPASRLLALDVKVILTPPCIFHSWFSIQSIQGPSG